ncbi:MAG: beta-lactamase family protein [Clostridia bacterium]|nr:beta-lactamase family protein [Clostridia bacterium]
MKAMMNPELTEAIRWFTREKEIMSGMLLACGNDERTEYAMDGEVRENSVFDLASLTKLFTGLCAMKLKEEGLLDPSRSVFSYDSRFTQMQDVTVEQIMGFTQELRTPGRIDACGSREEALNCLFGVFSVGEPKGRAYSDIPSMVLKYVIEAAGGEPFTDCIRKTVLEPAKMTETWVRVPEERVGDCLSYDGEYRIEGEKRIHRTGMKPGIPHDPKAAMIQRGTEDLCGHAGLFSTEKDMVRFCRAILEGKIVSKASLQEMAVNRTGRRRTDGSYTQYLGYQCFVRHPDQYYSEIPRYMGRQAFGNAGFTGNHLSVDPEHGIFTFFLGNRVRNRLTVLLPEENKTLEDYGLNADGSGKFRWRNEDGTSVVIPSSVKYVHQKDEHLHRTVAKVLGLKEIPF